MLHLFELMHEYRALVSAHADLPHEGRARMIGLARVLGSHAPWQEARLRKKLMDYPARFTCSGGVERGEIRCVSGGGMTIHTKRPPLAGSRTLVRLTDPGGAVEYVFPARVVWRTMRFDGGMGVIFDGPPMREDVHKDEFGLWRCSMSLGTRRLTPMVA